MSLTFSSQHEKSPLAGAIIKIPWKLTLAFLLFFNVEASANDTPTVTINRKNVVLSEVFKIIEDQTGFLFFYDQEMVRKTGRFDVALKGVTLKQALLVCLKDKPLTYSIVNNTVVIQHAGAINNEVIQVAQAAPSPPPPVDIRGRVVNKNGEPLQNVSIVVAGTKAGTSTNQEGRFTITAPNNSNIVLEVSSIGFQTRRVNVGSEAEITITLDEDVAGLSDVVVVGYGTAKRSTLAGATTSIATTEIKRQPSGRVDDALQGLSPGLVVQNNSAAPNGAVSIRIRGSNSINGSNDPLVVINGFIGGDLASLNPNDIASIEVLKDAASTAIYGSRGANGVILITTKSGTSSGKTVVEYNNFFNFQSILKKIDLLSAGQFAETVNANRTDLGLAAPFTAQQIADYKANGGTDWQDQIYRKALQQSHQMSVSGGTEKVRYYLSGNFIDNEGILIGSSFRRYTLRSNVEAKLSDKFTAGVNILFTGSQDHPVLTRGTQDQAPTHVALIFAPTLPVYQANGMYSRPSSQFGPPAVNNPLALAVEPIRDNTSIRAELNSFVDYSIIKGLNARVILGTRLVDDENNYYLNTKPQGGVGDALATITNRRYFVLQNTNQVNYQTNFGEKHSLNVTAVYEQQREISNNSFAGARGFLSDELTYNNLALGASPQIPTSFRSRNDIQSAIGRINYTLNDRYSFNVTGRYDGASVFGENNKWGFFPSGAFAWRVDKENFMQNSRTFSALKFRSSYGITGSQAVQPYSSLATLNTNQPYPINGTTTLSTGVGVGTIANSDLRWEKTAQFNVGVDVGILNNRIEFTADFYDKVTSDLLLNVPLPRISGYSTVLRNLGKVRNRGFELNLGGKPVVGKFSWSTNVNLSVNRNKVLALSGTEEITLGSVGFPNFGNTVYLKVGMPIGVLKGYIQDGTWGTADAAKATSYGTIPGAPKYVDQNNDGKITSSDITVMGTTMPKFTYGWSNTFSYKNFSLTFLIQGSEGNNVYNLTRIRSERSSSDADAMDVRILDRWTPDHQNTNVPSFKGSNAYEQLQSSRWLEDGSYIRLKNINLGYQLPKSLLAPLKISAARVYVGGVNLITVTDYTGYDPEASTNVGTFGGIDLAPYPSQKTYTVGLNITF